MSQESAVLARLERGPLTPLQALREIGCLRLGARIHRLRERGHLIDTDWVERGGKRYASYRLEKKRPTQC